MHRSAEQAPTVLPTHASAHRTCTQRRTHSPSSRNASTGSEEVSSRSEHTCQVGSGQREIRRVSVGHARDARCGPYSPHGQLRGSAWPLLAAARETGLPAAQPICSQQIAFLVPSEIPLQRSHARGRPCHGLGTHRTARAGEQCRRRRRQLAPAPPLPHARTAPEAATGQRAGAAGRPWAPSPTAAPKSPPPRPAAWRPRRLLPPCCCATLPVRLCTQNLQRIAAGRVGSSSKDDGRQRAADGGGGRRCGAQVQQRAAAPIAGLLLGRQNSPCKSTGQRQVPRWLCCRCPAAHRPLQTASAVFTTSIAY